MDNALHYPGLHALLTGGRDAYDAYSAALHTEHLDAWQAWPDGPQRTLAEKLLKARGNPSVLALDLTTPEEKLLKDVQKAIPPSSGVPTYEDYHKHAQKVAAAWRTQSLGEQSAAALRALKAGDITADEAAAKIRQAVNVAETIGAARQSHYMADIVARMRERTQEALDGKSSTYTSVGIPSLDELHLLAAGELLGIAAEAKQGKTSFAMMLAREVARRIVSEEEARGCVVIFSAEMTQEQLAHRLASSISRVPMHLIDDAKASQGERDAYMTALDELEKMPILVDPMAGQTPSQMTATLERYRDEYGAVRLIVWDYAALFRTDTPTASDHAKAQQFLIETKNVVKNLRNHDGTQAAGVVVVELNRTQGIPEPYTLKYAGTYEFAAVLALFDPAQHEHNETVRAILNERPMLYGGGELHEGERWARVLFNRNGPRAIRTNWRFVENCTRWEQAQWT